MGMSESIGINPMVCQQQAKDMVVDHLTKRYDGAVQYDVYIESFIAIGLTWRAVLATTLPNSGRFVVQYYALERKMSLRAYAMVEEISSYKG
jgi:formylmethanofuran dehydrogenase subunit A